MGERNQLPLDSPIHQFTAEIMALSEQPHPELGTQYDRLPHCALRGASFLEVGGSDTSPRTCRSQSVSLGLPLLS